MVYADEAGHIYGDSSLRALGRRGGTVKPFRGIPLPPGSDLVLLPGRPAIGLGPDGPREYGGWAVGAILPAGYTRTLLPVYSPGGAPLPLFGYTAVGLRGDRFYVAARPTDGQRFKWDPRFYNGSSLPRRIGRLRKKWPHNRLVEHLAHCALDYHCLTAQNIFYNRWEAGIPVSPACNARCQGCISLQESDCCPSPQGRISFVPRVEEICQLALNHLTRAREAIISFGQGCEGEPTLQAPLIAKAIKGIRGKTQRGTININTNGGYYRGLREIIDSGLDSMRVSLFSARTENYDAYHRPCGYSLADVAQSISYARERGVFVSLNLLVYPGFSDQGEEIRALVDFLRATGVNMVQLRNLNIDPDYLESLFPCLDSSLGIGRLIKAIEGAGVQVGNYSRPVKN
jgi:pyruvate-formate lyase-activating enzyme